MKTKINELVTKLTDLVEQLEYTNEQLWQAVDDYNDLHNIDWDIFDIYADANEDFMRSLNGIKSAIIDYMIFANKPF